MIRCFISFIFFLKLQLRAGPNVHVHSGAVGGKTSKTSVLPGFSKIERSGSSGAPPWCAALLWWSYLSRAHVPHCRRR